MGNDGRIPAQQTFTEEANYRGAILSLQPPALLYPKEREGAGLTISPLTPSHAGFMDSSSICKVEALL